MTTSSRFHGEAMVAVCRLITAIALAPILFLPGFDTTVRVIGGATWTVATLYALIMVHVVVMRYRPWLSILTTVIDVSFVSLTLLGIILIARQPELITGSRVLFEIYLLLIVVGAIRFDWRLVLLTGGLAALQFAGLLYLAQSSLGGVTEFHVGVQIARGMIVVAITIITTLVVIRGQFYRRLSSTDRLTGLYNRGFFDERIRQEIARSRRHRQPLTLALLDLDHFKHFNDRFGHTAGDRALQCLAGVLSSEVRREDLVLRYGGEEFAIIMPGANVELLQPRLDYIRQTLAQTTIEGMPDDVHLTVSIGATSLRAGDTALNLIDRADAALYAAKSAGRDAVHIDECAETQVGSDRVVALRDYQNDTSA